MKRTAPSRAIVAFLAWSAVLSAAPPVLAQSSEAPRGVVFSDLAYARSWDDEGLLGTGASVLAGGGYRITRRLTLQVIVNRIPYHRDIEYLTFDGRVLFVGGEVAFQSERPRVRPFVTFGAGRSDDQGAWVQKTSRGPGLPREETRVDRSYGGAMTTCSAGLDVRVTERVSVRSGVRWNGLLDTGTDLAPHSILQFSVGAAWYW